MELYLLVIFLGILQGITEFLPISSSGHLALAENIPYFSQQVQELEAAIPLLAFNVFLHLGTILAVVKYMLPEIKNIFLGTWEFLRKKNQVNTKLHLGLLTVVGSLPLILVPFIKDYVEKSVKSLFILGFLFLANSVLLLAADIRFRILQKQIIPKKIEEMNFLEAIFIGFFQALAVFPGISRSGATLTAALFLNFNGISAVHFSFLLSIPALFGATLFELLDVFHKTTFSSLRVDFILLGVLSSYIFGMFSIRFLAWLGKKMLFYPFGIYTALLGFTVLLLQRYALV